MDVLLVRGTESDWRYLLWYWSLHLAALAIVVGVLWVLHRLLKPAGGIDIWSVVVGKDKRVSTSKLQVALWSVFVPAALLSILLYAVPYLTQLSKINVPFDYLFLLGFPAATAIAAKTITTAKVVAGTVAKVEVPTDPDLARGTVEAVGDDQGNVEIFDLQYFLFNLVGLIFFLASFVYQPGPGPLVFPAMPDGLLGSGLPGEEDPREGEAVG